MIRLEVEAAKAKQPGGSKSEVTILRQSRRHSVVSRSKRQFRVANAAPHSWSHRFGGDSSPQAELVQPLVLLLLLLDVLPYNGLIATDC